MSSVSKTILIGRVGKDPELRKTPSGAPVCSFSMATSEKFTDKQGQKQEQTEWHNIVAWNKQAEILAQYVNKGALLYLEGKNKTETWEDNGVKKYKTNVVVTGFQFLESNKQAQPQQQQGGFQQQQAPQQNTGFAQQQPSFPPVQNASFPQQGQSEETPF